jgi:uncharacterized oxidoreductase
VPGREPIVLDMATSVIAQGKARVAYNKGQAIAPGQLLDDRGHPTTDPRYAVVEPRGALRTFGEHKGFGLALVCELLGGALAGGLALHQPSSGKQRVINGMLTILVDPARLGDATVFAQETTAFLDWVKASPAQQGIGPVQVAGDPERKTRSQRLADGVPVDSYTWGELLAAAASLGREPAELNRLAGMATP